MHNRLHTRRARGFIEVSTGWQLRSYPAK